MKQRAEKFDMSFLNKVMYIGAIVALILILKNLGVMDKIIDALIALTPVYIGIIICWISMPLANKLRRIGVSKSISAIVALIIIFGVLIAMVSFLIPMFINQFSDLLKEFPNIYSSIVNSINNFIHNSLHIETEFMIPNNFNKTALVQKYGSAVINYSINTLGNVVNFVVCIVTGIVVSFFMVKDIDKFKNGIIAFFSKNSTDNNRYKMLTEIDSTIMSYIKGIVIDSIIVGLMTTVVCMVLGLDYAVVFGILIAILNLIPYIGAVLSEVVAALYALSVGGPVLAIITFICLVVVQIIDANILQPNIIAKSVNLHPVVVLAGLIVFGLFWGIVGMFIAVPILAVLKIILKYKFDLEINESAIQKRS
ncbi:MAG: AI-2E family transporter [Clostridia bacterium]